MSSHVANANTEAAILSRLIEAGQDLSQSAAEYLLSIRFNDRDIERMNELSQKARDGALSEDEEAELDSYIHVGNLISIMQAKARLSQRNSGR
jgi:hypothetical protein